MIDKKTAAHWLSVILLAALVIGIVLGVVALAHGATSSRAHTNGLGVVIQAGNPNSYLAGAVTKIDFHGSSKNYGLEVSVQPLGTYTLYTEEVFLCTGAEDILVGRQNPLVLVYETQAHHLIDGIACHRLVAVRGMVSEKLDGN
jgi:hypothetical protein